jgi:hypothetical protein
MTGPDEHPEGEEAITVPLSIYVLPTEEDAPTRALIGFKMVAPDGNVMLAGEQVAWSNDSGLWVNEEGIPVPTDVGAAISQQARSLGVEGF